MSGSQKQTASSFPKSHPTRTSVTYGRGPFRGLLSLQRNSVSVTHVCLTLQTNVSFQGNACPPFCSPKLTSRETQEISRKRTDQVLPNSLAPRFTSTAHTPRKWFPSSGALHPQQA